MAVRPVLNKNGEQRRDHNNQLLWCIDYYPLGRKGKRMRLQFGGSRTSAGALEQELRRLHNDIHAPAPVRRKIIDLIPDWLADYQLNMAASTYRDVRSVAINYLTPWFGQLSIQTMTMDSIERYKAHRLSAAQQRDKDKHPCRRTVNKELAYLSSFVRWATDHGHADPLPFRIRPFPKVRSPKPRVLSPAEVDSLIEAVEDHYRLAVLLLVDAALRKKEALQLQTTDVDLGNGVLWIRGKGNKERIVPIMTQRLRQALEQRLATGPDGYLTTTPHGRGHTAGNSPVWSLDKPMARAAAKAKIKRKISHHLLRHTWATQAMIAGMDLRAIQGCLGHSTSATTEIYTHLAADYLKQQGERYARHTGQQGEPET